MYFWTLQVLITLFGICAIFLLSLKHKIRKWGFVAGLISDVFWVMFVISVGQYVFLVFTAFRIMCYINGIVNYFVKRRKNENTENDNR